MDLCFLQREIPHIVHKHLTSPRQVLKGRGCVAAAFVLSTSEAQLLEARIQTASLPPGILEP